MNKKIVISLACALTFTSAFADSRYILFYKHKDFNAEWGDVARSYSAAKQSAIDSNDTHPETGSPMANNPDIVEAGEISSGEDDGGEPAGTTVTATYATTNGNGTDGYTAGVTPNAYLDADAKTAGTATIDGVTGVWDGTYWKPQGDATKVLSGDFKVQVNASDIGGVSGNGLIYTGTNAPFDTTYRLDTHFGVTSWSTAECNSVNPRMNSTNVCATRGMWLPTPREANINTSDGRNACGGTGNIGGIGVFSHPSGFMWTTASATDDSKKFTSFTGTSTNSHGRDFSFYVRCVR
jgi:hypothetical protein